MRERRRESPHLTGAPIVTALPACHVVSHKNSRRVAPLSPLSRAHARQTLGVTLFIFCQRRTLSRHRSRRLQLPCSCFSSGAPFFRHRSCWVYYRSIMRVAPNTSSLRSDAVSAPSPPRPSSARSREQLQSRPRTLGDTSRQSAGTPPTGWPE